MKALIVFAFLLLLAVPASAAEKSAGYPPALGNMSPVPLDYISPDVVELTPQEKKALNLSGQWSRQDIDPVLSTGGKVIFVHGASLPTVIAAPYQVSDIELEQGEQILEFVVGDPARWFVEAGQSGSGNKATPHMFVKAIDAGLTSSLVILTDRRSYYIKLVSKASGHTHRVGFAYNDVIRTRAAQARAEAERAHQWDSTVIEGQTRSLANLNFEYEVKGRAAWRPERVYDDGLKCYLQLPSNVSETPILLVRKGKKEILVNYRLQDGKTIIVDGVHDRYSLILGVGKDQEKVEVIRKKGGK